MKRILGTSVLFFAMALGAGCGSSDSDSGGEPQTEMDNGDMPQSGGEGEQGDATARYRLTFNASWDADTHPVNFPGASAHFSPLIGAVHNEQIIVWQGGQFASDGIEQMAETGATGTLTQELQLANVDGTVDSIISGPGVAISPGQASVEFNVSSSYPLVTVVTMIAPSPDWFVGVHGQTLLRADGTFADSVVVDLAAYDAGTDNGSRFTSANDDSQPPQPIDLVTTDPLDTDFEFGLPFLGQFTFERIDL